MLLNCCVGVIIIWIDECCCDDFGRRDVDVFVTMFGGLNYHVKNGFEVIL